MNTINKYVYFAQADYGGPIKIGCSYDRDLRVQVLSAELPFNLVLIGWTRGGFFRERFVQAYFNHLAIKREWFQPTPELLRWAYQARTTGAIAELPPDLPHGYRACCNMLRLRLKGISLETVTNITGYSLPALRAELTKESTHNQKLMAAIDAAHFRERGTHVDWLSCVATPASQPPVASEAA